MVLLPFTDSSPALLILELDQAVQYYRSRAFATSTKQSYSSHLRSYMKYCSATGDVNLPITNNSLCRYAVHLAQRLDYKSIPKYLNVLRILHLELDMANPLQDNWFLNTVLKGIRREKDHPPNRKLAITPDILLSLKRLLHMTNPSDIMFWATCVVAFFGFFRKSNLLPRSKFDIKNCFTRGDVRRGQHGLLLQVRWSKTIQYHQREYFVPLIYVPGHPLCPVTALCALMLLSPGAPESAPLISINSVAGQIVLSQAQFEKKLQSYLTSLGLSSRLYSAHSLRRGAASWAFQAGLPGEIIQTMGDWRSDAYKIYLEISSETKFKYASKFSACLPWNT